MKAPDEIPFYPDDTEDHNRKKSKIRADLNDIRDTLDMMEMLIRTNQLNRLSAWMPDLKAAVSELENHNAIINQ
jgi:hypothetical protein